MLQKMMIWVLLGNNEKPRLKTGGFSRPDKVKRT